MFLLVAGHLSRRGPNWGAVRRNAVVLAVTGALTGLDWVCLFQAYRCTSVAVATLCYYMAPVFLLLATPFALGERLRARKVACIVVAMAGMVLVSGVVGSDVSASQLKGVGLALFGAVLYAVVVLLNMRVEGVDGRELATTQLVMAFVVTVPYMFLAGEATLAGANPRTIPCLLVLGVIVTGYAYSLYYGSIPHLPGQTVAIFGYLDPLVAVTLSVVVLGEPLGLLGAIGAVMILGATFVAGYD